MKNLFKISVLMLALIMILSGCGESTPEPTPTPTPATTPEAEAPLYMYDDIIEIDSQIIGQWVPVGVENANGYIQFTADGNMIRFTLGDGGEMNYDEVRYYLTGNNTFRMLRSDNSVSPDIEFEISEDGETLDIYTNPSLRVPSSFKRIN